LCLDREVPKEMKEQNKIPEETLLAVVKAKLWYKYGEIRGT